MTAERSTSVSTLVASWRALVEAASGECVRTDAFAAAKGAHPVFNNALLLRPEAAAVGRIEALYRSDERWTVWTGDPETDGVVSSAGLARDVATTDMWRALVDLPPPMESVDVERVDPGFVAEINGLSKNVVPDAGPFTALGVGGGAGGLLLFRHEDDAQLSFVAVRQSERRRGLATALVVAALHEAQRQGAATATLQAAPDAARLYARVGFEVVGRWQEWTRQSDAGQSTRPSGVRR